VTELQFRCSEIGRIACGNGLGFSGEPRVVLRGVQESDKWQKESPPAESRGSEQTPLRSKL